MCLTQWHKDWDAAKLILVTTKYGICAVEITCFEPFYSQIAHVNKKKKKQTKTTFYFHHTYTI